VQFVVAPTGSVLRYRTQTPEIVTSVEENKTRYWLHAVLSEPAVGRYFIRPKFWKGHKNIYFNFIGLDFASCLTFGESRNSSVGIKAGYGLDDWGVRVRVLVGSTIFSSPRRLNWLWGPPSPLSNGYRGKSGRGVKLTTHLQLVPRSINVDLYIYSPIRL
jgi:hypothetical protein